ncbi:hypothetical protein C5167_031185 [Papaver somniferum]|uniref:uncharacterized protein LOC113334106 isoform X1 n=1 Tax=Papaver somniferum TaxID=3469 RepID=UPI000E6FB915|nr:uncharacterized protein LOC113334106 isoform X1 [Papaver somniferum]XP_026436230.1 uncharacterized protein LOC113334106 isoform X1 [Papaver somniferum]XP_026436231.1 uncharacterized protein LOC113334106 isoform X1 [Papaver somniferum]RZC88812.1 hypothetical protein C5167_031185 [Papaver somniferum]
MREPAPRPLVFTPFMEGTSALPCSAGSTSSRSDGSEYEPMAKTHASSNRNFSSRCSFMSKPIYPVSFSNQAPDREAHLTIANRSPFNLAIPNDGSSNHNSDLKSVRNLTQLQSMVEFPEIGSNTPQREAHRWSSASSSMDFTDSSEQLDSERVGPSYHNQGGGEFKCGLCERFLSQRSPWSSHRIVRNGDMPVTGVLSCSHVFHADCLDQSTPKMQKQDPTCPLCSKSSEENSMEPPLISRLRNGLLPKLRSSRDEIGSARPWGCGQVGDCVEGALHASPRNNMLLLNRNRLKKHRTFKGDLSKEVEEKFKKSGSFSSHLFHGKSAEQDGVGCSRKVGYPVLKRR